MSSVHRRSERLPTTKTFRYVRRLFRFARQLVLSQFDSHSLRTSTQLISRSEMATFLALRALPQSIAYSTSGSVRFSVALR